MFRVNFHYSWLPSGLGALSNERQLFAMLDGIRREESLRAAVRDAGLSYRYAWGLIGRWEKLFGQALVTMQRGRGTQLTPFGEKLLWAQHRIQARLGPRLEDLTSEIERELSSVIDSVAVRINMAASHDLALTALRDLLDKHRGPRLDIRFLGSVDSLCALAARKTEMAGFHTSPGADTGALKDLLTPRTSRVIRFVKRTQGLMVAAGNPKHILELADLSRARVKFVNRQTGSGTRLALDRLLANAAIPARRVNGYAHEEYTHLAVAATIASGHADAGLGIEAAAREYKLDFVALFTEQYFLACRADFLESEKAQHLLGSFRKPGIIAALKSIPGYDVEGIGDVHPVASAFALP